MNWEAYKNVELSTEKRGHFLHKLNPLFPWRGITNRSRDLESFSIPFLQTLIQLLFISRTCVNNGTHFSQLFYRCMPAIFTNILRALKIWFVQEKILRREEEKHEESPTRSPSYRRWQEQSCRRETILNCCFLPLMIDCCCFKISPTKLNVWSSWRKTNCSFAILFICHKFQIWFFIIIFFIILNFLIENIDVAS